MAIDVVLHSDQTDDIDFFTRLCEENRFILYKAEDLVDLETRLRLLPNAYFFWNIDSPLALERVNPIISRHLQNDRVFYLSSSKISRFPALDSKCFSHFILRRYPDFTLDIYKRLLPVLFGPKPIGIHNYFPSGSLHRDIEITHSSQKIPFVELLENHLTQVGLPERLANLISTATDELLMNAIFDAPVDHELHHYRNQQDRSELFAMSSREQVKAEVMISDRYGAICVTDQFGSLPKGKVIELLAKDYRGIDYSGKTDQAGAGLGLHHIAESGLSLLFLCESGIQTAAMIFFPRVKSQKEFKLGFQFFSVLINSERVGNSLP